MFPLERFKTNQLRTNLIDAIYVRLLAQIALLEQTGMKPVTQEDVERFVYNPQNAKLADAIQKDGYTFEGFAAKKMLVLNYALFISRQAYGGISEALFAPQSLDAETLREQWIFRAFSFAPEQPKVMARAMLLENARLARSLERRVRAGENFARLAQRYSLTRSFVGGAISETGEETPSLTSLTSLEPELQAALGVFAKPGLIRVPAPFGRAWLVNIIAYEPAVSFSQRASKVPSAQNSLSNGRVFTLSATTDNDLYLDSADASRNDPRSEIQALDPSVSLVDPIVGRVGTKEFRLVSWFANTLLAKDATDFEQIEAELPKTVEAFLTKEAVHQELPYGGAGAESGLETYLAARANVSEMQLKFYYDQNRTKFLLGNNPFYMQCQFENKDYASHWRGVFVFAASEAWINGISYQCDTEGEADPLPLPEMPSQSSLIPIAGGYITKVFQHRATYYFLALYRFLPQPIQKPFVLVRGEVEQQYRLIVARKRLPTFELELRARAGVQNLLAEGLRELEVSH